MPRWDDRLLKYVNEELQYLWDMGAEFEEQNPGVAPYLRLTATDAQDPFVERLLDGFAFLSARVRLKLDDEFPRFTQTLLESVHPHYLAPTPSATVVEFIPKMDEGNLADGYPIERDAVLKSVRSGGDTRCTFLTKDSLTLWPLAVKEAKYYASNDLGEARVNFGADVKAAVRIRLETKLPGLPMRKLAGLDRLRFYLKSMPRSPIPIYEQLFAHSKTVQVRVSESETVPASTIHRVGFDDRQAMFPVDPRCFQGYRLLREYFMLPERFLFFEISNLKAAFERCGQTWIELVIPLRQEERALPSLLTAANFSLFCVPAINLFPEAIRADITEGGFEFPLIPRLNPEAYEVFSVNQVIASGSGTGQQARARALAGQTSGKAREQNFWPFYRMDDHSRGGGAYYTVRRLDRRLERAVPDDKTREQFLAVRAGARPSTARDADNNARDNYKGSDVYVSLVDANEAPFSSDLTSMTAECYCTNRGMPLTIRPGEGASDFSLAAGAPVMAIRCTDGLLSPPRPSYAHGDFNWRLVNHLTVNYLSLSAREEAKAAAALRMLLGLYTHATDPESDPRVQAVQYLRQRPITHRMPVPGQVCFARGSELTLGLDERAFQGTGAFLLGAVLEQFFAKYVSINSFTQTVLESAQRGEVMKWPARIGRRETL